MAKLPERIWLQWEGEDPHQENTTWGIWGDLPMDDDAEYVRADIVGKLREEIDHLRENIIATAAWIDEAYGQNIDCWPEVYWWMRDVTRPAAKVEAAKEKKDA